MSPTAPTPPIRIYNTLTRAKEPFVPLQPGKASVYVCGVTVYSSSHIGHARSGVSFDVALRYLLHRGFEVTFVKNFTDVDDKIIKRANAEGVESTVISERYIAEFYQDMDSLYILRPDHEPKVTGFIPQIISMVETLIARGHAYEAGGDVFYDISTKPDYGKLSRRQLDEQEEGARVDVDERKRHPFDFVLWKAAKPGEPAWESPWGQGRPGWHIECSAMGVTLLGEHFDIHGGGSDLVFPHHENEIAQTEGATGIVPWVNIWMHNGMITIDQLKMSKSLDNFFTIQQVLARYDPETLRVFFLSAHYRNPLDFSEESIAEAEQRAERLYATLGELDRLLGERALPLPDPAGGWRREHLYRSDRSDGLAAIDTGPLGEEGQALHASIAQLLPQVEEAMDDDFNAAKALGHTFDLVRRLNRWLDSAPDMSQPAQRALAAAARDRLLTVGAIVGLFHQSPAAYFEGLRQRRLAFVGLTEAEIQAAIDARNQARARKEFALSDGIRDDLLTRGVALRDSPAGTTWEVQRRLG